MTTMRARAHELAVLQRAYSTAARKKMSKSGSAEDDGSYPIKTAQDVQNAARDWYRSHGSASDKAHIISRAKAIGATAKLPADWPGSTNKSVKQATVAYGSFNSTDAQTAVVLGDDNSLTKTAEDVTNPSVMCPNCRTIFDFNGMPEIPQVSLDPTPANNTAPQDLQGMRAPGAAPSTTTVVQKDGQPSIPPFAEGSQNSGEVTLQDGNGSMSNADVPSASQAKVGQKNPQQGAKKKKKPVNQGSPILQMDGFKRVVTAVIQEPDSPTTPMTMPDTELIYPSDTVRDMAWNYLEELRNGETGTLHGEVRQTDDGDYEIMPMNGEIATMVESFLAPCAMEINGTPVVQGSWVASWRIKDEDTWQAILNGQLRAPSLSSVDYEFEDMSNE